ncbi:MAG TPA: hypothetical protein VLX32_06230 [Candidatus Acidoferrum sp.]|nr:hypothetical protein [Candidatus Acidoferrum sp.]
MIRANTHLAKELWGMEIQQRHVRALRDLGESFGFSVARGDILLLNGNWYVTHAGLLRLASRNRCCGINTRLVPEHCERSSKNWVFKATVYKRKGSKGFVGYGDADPSNVSPLVRGAEMRVAETRAVNRALRKAYGIGLCSVEELGWLTGPPKASENHQQPAKPHASNNGSNNGQPRLRDRLCLLIRQYDLDPTLVKAYAADFCGTATLKDATRDSVESFVSHLASSAKENRGGLVCKLNSYAQPVEVKS